MSTNGHTITVGDVILATIDGEQHLLTIEKFSFMAVHTSDWRIWWYGNPAHEDGEPLVPSDNRLHVHHAPARSHELVRLEAVAA